MKKNLVIALLILFSQKNFSQQQSSSDASFHKGTILTGLNFNLGIYNTDAWLNDFPSFHHPDRAGSGITTLWGEYGVLNWLGVGINLQKSAYITDSSNNGGVKPTISSFDYGVRVSAHVFRKKHFNLPITFVVGGSSFTDNNNVASPNEASLKGSGSFTNFYLNPTFFFGKSARFGMNIKLGWANYAYNSLNLTTHTTTNNNFYTLHGSGGNIGIGFQFNIK